MPDKPLTVLTYAASASLAAIALVYLYNPSYILDPGAAAIAAGADSRLVKRGRAVGLHNPANDCFINSVLQALAGLGALQSYLEQELGRRDLDDEGRIYGYRAYLEEKEKELEAAQQGESEKDNDGRPGAGLERRWKSAAHERKVRSMLHAEVTRGLKTMLDQLHENKHATRKTISAAPFVRALESAFATRVNRNQQDAQELLQVVAERMAEEYNAGRLARERARAAGTQRKTGVQTNQDRRIDREVVNAGQDRREQLQGNPIDLTSIKEQDHYPEVTTVPTTTLNGDDVLHTDPIDEPPDDEEDGFPLQGQTKHQIECSHCQFIPSSKPTDFIMLTLSVPPKSFATLDECLDQFSKPEYIDDYKCDKCRLEHAVSILEKELSDTTDETQKENLQTDVFKLKLALQSDPENPPPEVPLPDSKLAPTRRIARSVKILSFPRILVIHLSRSSFDPTAYSSKNTAKVSFPEILKLGSLTDRRSYRLIAVVTHKGTHYSGHYETFRRQHPYPLHAEDLVATDAADAEMDGDDGTEGARSPTPSTARATTRSAAASPEPRGRKDSDFEDEALEAMVGEGGAKGPASASASAATTGHSSTSDRRSTSRRKSPLSSPRPDSTTATPLSVMPTPESVLEQGHDASGSSAKPSLDVPGAAPPMERAGSRQQFRDRFEEAKEKKKDKRLRKLVARENQRWWRISDDRVRECRTQEVLDMMKEVYLLFYEMET